MKRLLLVILLVLMAFAIPLGASARTRPIYYTVQLQDLNNSGVHGRVILIQRDNELRVIVVARGLEKNMVHMQHIHGFTATTLDSTCPPPSAAGSDGILTLQEGMPYYGPVILPLLDTNGDYPTASRFGVVRFSNTFDLAPLELTDLSPFTIVIHGMTVNGAYDGSLPVACGQINLLGRQAPSS